MNLHVQLPADLEASVRAKHADLETLAKEALLLELYRRGELDRPQLAEALGVDRHELAALLQRHGIHEGAYAQGDLDEDRSTLGRLFGHDAA